MLQTSFGKKFTLPEAGTSWATVVALTDLVETPLADKAVKCSRYGHLSPFLQILATVAISHHFSADGAVFLLWAALPTAG